ncbi:chemokine XC receptor 1 [Silurus asotus]|uniref:Chemokine XC receptor 1 n=1 Tax=Silurus asotus TaxID=30991 RepID=A0AAD5A3U5_SILAS|nr:chemokine XC receptor 1 [Silurus asotus]
MAELSNEFNSSYNSNLYYDYYDYYTFICDHGSEAEYSHIAIPIIFSIVIILSLIGNVFVVGISVFSVRLQSVIGIFILNLALSDLLLTIGLLLWLCIYFWSWTFGVAGCKVSIFFSFVGFYSCIVFLVLMSVQRYIAVVHPFQRWKTGRCLNLVLVIVWLVSTLAALPATVHVTLISEVNGIASYCGYSSITASVAITYEEIIVFVCAYLGMFFFYIRILQTILMSPTNQRHTTTRLAFILVVTYFICCAPYTIVNILVILEYDESFLFRYCKGLGLPYVVYICQLLAFSHCCFNPLIYGLFSVKFRLTVREIFQRRATLNSAQMRMA